MSKFDETSGQVPVKTDSLGGERTSGDLEAELTVADVARDLLGLDPVALAEMDPHAGEDNEVRDHASSGFNILVRKAMGLALVLRDDDDAALQLVSEATARASGWPDARIANLATVLAWALVNETRAVQGLPNVPLMSADDGANDASRQAAGSGGEEPATASELIDVFKSATFDCSTRVIKRRDLLSRKSEDRLGRTPVASTNGVIREVLGIEPREMADMLGRREELRPGRTFDADPEAAGQAGLLMVMRDALTQVRVMRRREVDRIRLMSDVQAREEGWTDSRAARLTTLISAALLHGDPRDVTLLPPRDPIPGREDLLMAVASDVYFFGSETAFQGFELLCDEDVRFGVNRMRNKARRLLWRVNKEQDPHGHRLLTMPISINEELTLLEAADILNR